MARSRVELFEQVRRDRRVEGLSIRELADRHRVHRRTVRVALASAVPPPRKAYPPRARPAIDPYVEIDDGWLLADRDVPRKQRHTARRGGDQDGRWRPGARWRWGRSRAVRRSCSAVPD